MTQDTAILDFGSAKITVLIGSRGPNNSVQISSAGECKYAGFQDGQWLRPEILTSAVAKAVSDAESNCGTKIKHLYIGVPGEFSACVTKNVALSFNKRRKVTQKDIDTLHNQGAEFPDAPGYVLIGCQPVYYTLDDERRMIEPVGLASKRLGGLISYILAESKFTNFIDSIMESIGVETAEYVSSIVAQTMFLLDANKRDRTAVFIDIGYITSSVAVARGDGLLSLNSFSMGGGNITADLAGYFEMRFEDAEALKRKVMISLVPESDDVYEIKGREYSALTVNKLVSARVATLAKAIKKCLEQCKFEIPSSAVYCLTGGGVSYMRGAKELIGQFLDHDIEIAAPVLPHLNKPHLSSAIGLLDMTLEANEEAQPQKKSFWSKIFG